MDGEHVGWVFYSICSDRVHVYRAAIFMAILVLALSLLGLLLFLDCLHMELWHLTNQLHWLGLSKTFIQFIPFGSFNIEAVNIDTFLGVRLRSLWHRNELSSQLINRFVCGPGTDLQHSSNETIWIRVPRDPMNLWRCILLLPLCELLDPLIEIVDPRLQWLDGMVAVAP